MNKPSVFAAVAGLMLVSAAPPQASRSDAPAASSGYPPCSRTVTDRCIQLYERGVRTQANLAANRAGQPDRPAKAVGGPYESASTAVLAADRYPPCSATVTDRCTQTDERRTTRRAYARSVRAAGERG